MAKSLSQIQQAAKSQKTKSKSITDIDEAKAVIEDLCDLVKDQAEHMEKMRRDLDYAVSRIK